MNIRRRHLVAASAAAALLGARAHAQPAQPMRLLVGFGAGGATDGLARVLAQSVSEILKVPVIVENKPGANQIIAIQALRAGPADGSVLLMGTGSGLAQNPALQKNLPYDPRRDFAPVALAGRSPGVIAVRPSLSARTLDELVSAARAAPGTLNYGSSGVGSANHLCTAFFLKQAGLRMEHIPLKSDGAVGVELAEGRIDMAIMTLQVALPLAQAGRIRLLMLTSVDPVPAAATVPTLASAPANLRQLDPYTFFGVVAPAGTPPQRIDELNRAFNEAAAMPQVRARLENTLMLQPAPGTPQDFAAYLEREFMKWSGMASSIQL